MHHVGHSKDPEGESMRERVAITLALSVAGTAFAGTFSELESNNTIGTANSLGLFDVPGGSVVIDAYLGDNDVDWYSFTLADTSLPHSRQVPVRMAFCSW